MSQLFILCGLPGSGKSTLADYYQQNRENTIWISRDAIRFELLNDDEKYFAKETKVYNEFIKRICENLNQGIDVIADQTSLTKSARKKLLTAIRSNGGKYEKVFCTWLNTPLEVCLDRNANRTGRTFVPPSAIQKMAKQMEVPVVDEGFADVIEIDGVD